MVIIIIEKTFSHHFSYKKDAFTNTSYISLNGESLKNSTLLILNPNVSKNTSSFHQSSLVHLFCPHFPIFYGHLIFPLLWNIQTSTKYLNSTTSPSPRSSHSSDLPAPQTQLCPCSDNPKRPPEHPLTGSGLTPL